MPPLRIRAQDDTPSEVSTVKERHATTHPSGIGKSKRPAGALSGPITANHKDAKAVPLAESATLGGHDASTGHNGGVSSHPPHALLPPHDSPRLTIPPAQIDWTSLPARSLHAYRHAHRLAAPAAFASSHNQLVLADPAGLGALSPTMAGRARTRGRAPKEALAQAVRRDCNATPVNETEAIAAFLYRVKNQSRFGTERVMREMLMGNQIRSSGRISLCRRRNERLLRLYRIAFSIFANDCFRKPTEKPWRCLSE